MVSVEAREYLIPWYWEWPVGPVQEQPMLFKWRVISLAPQWVWKYLKKWITTTLWYLEDKMLHGKENKIKQKWHCVKRPNQKRSTFHPYATKMRPATPNITERDWAEGDWASLSQSIKYLSKLHSQGKLFLLFCSFCILENLWFCYIVIYMVFASFKVCFLFFPCRYVFACLPDILHFQLSLRGTPSFPGHQTPWMLMVQNLIFFKDISNTLLSYFGCRASRKWLKMVLLLKYQVP